MTVGPIGFHRVRGENIRVNKFTATRVESFNKALCFTDRPLRIDEKLTFRISQVTRAWSGTLRVGVTIHDPITFENNLPKYCCPDLNMKPGNWGKAVEEAHAVENTTLQVFYTAQGHLMLKVNDNEPEQFLAGIRTNGHLYVLFDIYGNTQGIELIGVQRFATATATPTNESTVPPTEIPVPPAQRSNDASLRSESFPNVELRSARLAVVDTPHMRASTTVASGLTGQPGGLAVISSTISGGETLIVTLRDLHRRLPINLALSSASLNEILQYNSLEDLCEETYSVLFTSGATSPGEELAIVVSEQGVVHVSHAGKKWFKCLYVDPNVQFRVVMDMQPVKKLEVVGITTQVQAPSNSASRGDSSSKSDQAKGATDDGARGSTDCVICLEKPRDTLLKPCLHFVLCGSCARLLTKNSYMECPMCRKPVRGTEKIYMN